jgi:hypothetical protein
MATVVTSAIAATPNWRLTTDIRASEPTLTPSSTSPAMAERRRRGTSGPLTATKKKAGRKMPTVATVAPRGPSKM